MLNQTDELQRLRKGTVGLDVPTAVERLIARTEPERARTAFNRIREVLDVVLSVGDVASRIRVAGAAPVVVRREVRRARERCRRWGAGDGGSGEALDCRELDIPDAP